MTDDRLSLADVEALVRDRVERARAWQVELSPSRRLALEYYRGDLTDLPAPDGRSQIVTTEFRDTVRAQLPSLVRIFLGPERVVEFEPRSPQQEAEAKQRTAYLDVVLREDNDALRVFYAWFKDADHQMGVVKWWWEPVTETQTHDLTGLLPEQVALLQADDDVTFVVTRETPSVLDDGTPVTLYDVRVTRVTQRGRARYDVIPPERFLYDPDSGGDLEALPFVGEDMDLTPDELRAMGFTDEEIAQAEPYADELRAEADARSPVGVAGDPHWGIAPERVRYTEAYVLCDPEATGRASRYRACLLGNQLVRFEPWPEVPYAVLVVDPTPHRLDGTSTFDLTHQINRAKTAALRATLDSFAFAVNPRLGFQDGMVEVKDLMNPEIGGLVRTYAPPANVLFPIGQDFVGRDGLTLMSYLDEVRENATGVTKAAAGLDADSLQSSTRAAVAATVSGAQQHLELKARVFAETGIKRLIKGLAGLVRRHQDFERTVRLTGQWVTVDPRAWVDDLHVRINVALGLGSTEDKLTGLLGIIAKQENYLQQLGPVNPLTNLALLRNALAKAIELMGWPSADAFFSRVDEQALQQQAAEAANQPPQPTPEQVLAQAQLEVEKVKAEKEFVLKQADLDLKRQDLALKAEIAAQTDSREREKTDLDAALRVSEMELQYNKDVTLKQMDVAMEDAKQETAVATKLLDHEQQAQQADRQAAAEAAKPPAPPARKRRVKVVRGPDGKITGAEVEESEG